MSPICTWLLLLISVVSFGAQGQSEHVLCNRGFGAFDTSFAGVAVHVGAIKSGAFATRGCEATLHWRDHEEEVVEHAEQVDVDVLGADFGLGTPVVAFIVRPDADDWRQNYEVWSLGKKPRRLLTLEGEDRYKALDAETNGHVAIWTTDASAVEGFDGLKHSDFVSPPTVVLRLAKEGVLDVSAWYRSSYDRHIDELRQSLTADDLAGFQKSSGQLIESSMQAKQIAALRKTKATILEIVWAYLYSGRPEQAWTELSNTWPADDVPRVKAAILAARANGIKAQVAKVIVAQPSRWSKKAKLFEPPPNSSKQDARLLQYGTGGLSGIEQPSAKDHDLTIYGKITEPEPISLWRPPLSAEEHAFERTEEKVRLTIDQAGKVDQASMVTPSSDPHLLDAAKDWKFVPAFINGGPVMYRMELAVQPLR